MSLGLALAARKACHVPLSYLGPKLLEYHWHSQLLLSSLLARLYPGPAVPPNTWSTLQRHNDQTKTPAPYFIVATSFNRNY